MIFNVESVELIFFFVFGISFIVFMNIQLYYKIQLKNLLKKKYPSLYKNIIWLDLRIGGLFIARPPFKLFRYVWFNNPSEKDILFLIKRIRLFKILAIITIVLFLMIINIIPLVKV